MQFVPAILALYGPGWGWRHLASSTTRLVGWPGWTWIPGRCFQYPVLRISVPGPVAGGSKGRCPAHVPDPAAFGLVGTALARGSRSIALGVLGRAAAAQQLSSSTQYLGSRPPERPPPGPGAACAQNAWSKTPCPLTWIGRCLQWRPAASPRQSRTLRAPCHPGPGEEGRCTS